MRKALCVIAVLLLLPLVPAQAQVEAPSWEIGWESDVDDGVILNLDGNRWAVSHTLEIWIANNRPFELEVDAPAEPLSMVARGAAERCCAQPPKHPKSIGQSGARRRSGDLETWRTRRLGDLEI